MDRDKDVRAPETAATPTQTSRPDPNEVARLAYFYYEERGFAHGWHEDDWYRAEQELQRRGTADASSSSSTRTVVGVFNTMNDARRALEDLDNEGFSRDEISFIAKDAGTDDLTDRSDVAADAGIGAAVGGVGGLLLGIAGLAIPGIGPVMAAGPIIAALGGAGLGAAAGGLIGALTERGVPKDVASQYAEGVRRGDVIVTVTASGARADRAKEILDRNGAIDIDDRVSNWRQRGWTGYDANAQPLSADELRREREYLQAEKQQAREWSRAEEAKTKSEARASRVYAATGPDAGS